MSLALAFGSMKTFPLAVLAAAMMFAGAPAAAGPVLERIKARGKIVVAHRESSVPFSYLDADRKAIGYAVELCGRVAEAVRKSLQLKALPIEYLLVTPGDRIAAVAEGRADLVVGKFLTIEPLAIMLPKDDAAFKLVVDDEMKRLIATREAHAIFERWFMRPIPPKNTALNLPMNYLLKDFWKYPTDQVPG